MIYPQMNSIMKQVDSKYTLVVAVAKRARQLVGGAEALVNHPSDKPVTVAINEVDAGKIGYERTKEGIK